MVEGALEAALGLAVDFRVEDEGTRLGVGRLCAVFVGGLCGQVWGCALWNGLHAAVDGGDLIACESTKERFFGTREVDTLEIADLLRLALLLVIDHPHMDALARGDRVIDAEGVTHVDLRRAACGLHGHIQCRVGGVVGGRQVVFAGVGNLREGLCVGTVALRENLLLPREPVCLDFGCLLGC